MNEGKFIIHYEEFGGKDYEADVGARELVAFYQQVYGYPREKANLIVGGIEKLDIEPLGGIPFIVSCDRFFYTWANGYFKKQARNALGYETFLLSYLDSDGEYQEEEILSTIKAKETFEAVKKVGLPCALRKHSNRKNGWVNEPMCSFLGKKVLRGYERKHLCKKRR